MPEAPGALNPLPIDPVLPRIASSLRQDGAVVVVAEPGAGKSTRVPPFLLSFGRAILLQPRRAAARAIATRIAQEQGWTLGREVGWQMRFDSRFAAETRLLVATEGILTLRLQQDPFLSDFDIVILDEFHERSIHADLALALCKQARRARPDLRLVVMSATLDADRLGSYLDDCSVVRVEGRQHPVDVSYVPERQLRHVVMQALVDTTGDILVFRPGTAEIRAAVDELRHAGEIGASLLSLHGGMSSAEQQGVLDTRTHARRIIVATNVAETSLTVHGVTAVVDSGKEKVARYDAARAIDGLFLERISQAAAEQRAGRAGRLQPGRVYRQWSASDKLKPFREPDIRRIDLSAVALAILAWGGSPRTLDWFEPPDPDALQAAMLLLERLGATDGARLTPLGARMATVPLPPRLARVLLSAGGSREAARACALLAEGSTQPPVAETTDCDLTASLDRWDLAPANVRRIADYLERHLSIAQPGERLPKHALRRALLLGYPDRVAKRRADGSDRAVLSTGVGAVLDRESGVRRAEYFVALELRRSQGPSAADARVRLASAVERDWLHPTLNETRVWLDDTGTVRAARVTRYGALVLAEHPTAPDAAQAADLLSAARLKRGPSDADTRLLRRAAFAGVTVDYEELVRLASFGERRLDDLDVTTVLPLETARALETKAPEWLVVPSGRRVRLEYEPDGSVSAAVKLQELFGLAATPTVGPLNQPVLMTLLAPNGRPVQMTRDLRSFWDRTYPEVRRELRGRYPRHPWPEDPWTAPATARVKPRL